MKRGYPGVFFEKIGEMRHLLEAQGVGNRGDVPLGLFEQDLGFLREPPVDDFGSAPMGRFFERFVQVVDVDVECLRKIVRTSELDGLLLVLDRKLPFEQFDEQSADSRSRIDFGRCVGNGL